MNGATAHLQAAADQAQGLRKARPADVPRLARALARAFDDDPVSAWFIPDARRRLAVQSRTFAFYLRKVALRHELSYTTGGVVGGALWLPPGKWKAGPLAQLRLLPGTARSFGRFLPRVLRGFAVIERAHPDEPHYYLPFVGVSPEWQGKGLGTALLQPVLRRCDAEGTPAYLEASTPRNRACYERNGFRVVEEMRLPDGGPPLWTMWREPAPPREKTRS